MVSKWSTISFKNVHYSVPDNYVGVRLMVRVYSEKIVILDKNEKVASHQRSYKSGDWCIILDHYLKTFVRKPGAMLNSLAWHNAPEEIKELYNRHFSNNNKAFVSLLLFAKENNFSQADLINASNELKTRGLKRISH